MTEYIKIDKAKIVKLGVTFIRKGGDEVELIIQSGMPPECVAVFVPRPYWDEIKDRIYA